MPGRKTARHDRGHKRRRHAGWINPFTAITLWQSQPSISSGASRRSVRNSGHRSRRRPLRKKRFGYGRNRSKTAKAHEPLHFCSGYGSAHQGAAARHSAVARFESAASLHAPERADTFPFSLFLTPRKDGAAAGGIPLPGARGIHALSEMPWHVPRHVYRRDKPEDSAARHRRQEDNVKPWTRDSRERPATWCSSSDGQSWSVPGSSPGCTTKPLFVIIPRKRLRTDTDTSSRKRVFG